MPDQAITETLALMYRNVNLALAFALLAPFTSCETKTAKTIPKLESKASTSEIFHLRSECEKLSEKLLAEKEQNDLPYCRDEIKASQGPSCVEVEQESNYKVASNHCYTKLTIHEMHRNNWITSDISWTSELFDAQLRKPLAVTINYAPSTGTQHRENYGRIDVPTSNAYPDTYQGSTDLISDAMQDERQMP